MDEVLALLMLAELPFIGERTLARVQAIVRWKRLRLADVLSAPPTVLAEEYGLAEAAIELLVAHRAEHEASCRGLLARLRAAGVTISQPHDPEYPRRLDFGQIGPPPVVYGYGNRTALESRTIAVLCSRDLTEQSVMAVLQIVQCAARERLTLITGGMKATHRIAAVAVRAAGTSRVVVLDRGLFAAFGPRLRSDPFGFGPARARLDLRHSLVLSPFRCEDHAAPRNGRRRDQLVAALADVVVAARARPGGEIERICLQALDAGRCVLTWQAESATLVAAGAAPLDVGDLRDGLSRLVARAD